MDSKRVVSPQRMIELMWQMDHAMHARSKRMQKTLGVTSPQRVVLSRIDAHGAMTPNALAQSLHLHPSTLTGILQRLEASKLVSRRRHATDSRKMLIDLTAAGRKLARKSGGSIESIIESVFGRSTTDEVECAYKVLGRIVESLE